MQPIHRPELGKLSAYSITMLKVILADLERELEVADRAEPRSRRLCIEIARRIMQVELELKWRKGRRRPVVPKWPFEGGAVVVRR